MPDKHFFVSNDFFRKAGSYWKYIRKYVQIISGKDRQRQSYRKKVKEANRKENYNDNFDDSVCIKKQVNKATSLCGISIEIDKNRY